MFTARRALAATFGVLLLSASASFHAQAPDVGPYTFGTLAFGGSGADGPDALAMAPSGAVVVIVGSRVSSGGRIRTVEPSGAVTTFGSFPESLGGVAVDGAGNIYRGTPTAGLNGGTVRKTTPDGVTTTIASSGPLAPGTVTLSVVDVAASADGTVYVATPVSIYRVSTDGVRTLVAGGAQGSVDGTGEAAQFSQLSAIAVDTTGTVYVSDAGNNTVRRVSSSGVVTTLAGTFGSRAHVDGTGAAARFTSPAGLAVDGTETVYVADNETIRQVTSAGVVTTIAGSPGTAGLVNGTGSAARFSTPRDVTIGAGGVLHVADYGNDLVRTVTTAGVVTTFALVAPPNATGVNSARLTAPEGVAAASDGFIYVADTGNHVIRRMGPTGVSTIVAGISGMVGNADDSGLRFTNTSGLAINGNGTLFIADRTDRQIHALSPGGALSVVAGRDDQFGWRDGVGVKAVFGSDGLSLAINGSGELLVADTSNRTIRKVTADGTVSTLAGFPGSVVYVDSAFGPARFLAPAAVAVDASGLAFVADSHSIRTVTAAGVVATLAGGDNSGGSADGTGTAARFRRPQGLVVDGTGNLFVADTDNHTIRKVTSSGVVTTVAGTALSSGSTDGTGAAARFSFPSGIGLDGAGNLYVISGGNTIRKIAPDATVTTVVSGLPGIATLLVRPDGSMYAGGTIGLHHIAADGTRTTVGFNHGGFSAQFNFPRAIAVDNSLTLYIADTGNHSIRKRTPAGVVTTLAGLPGTAGTADGTGRAATFSSPAGVAVHGTTVFVADTANHTIRAISAAGVVTTFAGTAGQSGAANGTGSDARFNTPRGIAVDSAGVLYVADTGNHVIRRISTSGVTTTLTGLANTAGSADGPAGTARFSSPSGIAVDAAGVLYVADTGNHTMRVITTDGVTTTVGGSAGAPLWLDGEGTASRFMGPIGVAVSSAGTMYIADTQNYAIRHGYLGTATLPVITSQPVSQTILKGQTATFSVAATGHPAVAYQWQYSTNGGTSWSTFDGETGASVVEFRNRLVRCVVSNAAGSVTSNAATLTVHQLDVTPTSLRFGARRASMSSPLLDQTPAQAVTVSFGGTGTPAWTATSRVPWLRVTGGTQTGNGTFTVSVVNPDSLFQYAGPSQVAAIDVEAPALGLATVINVELELQTTDAAPVGAFDTPRNNATGVTGSIAVTGWALDDLGIARTEIWRNCVESIDRARGACMSPAAGVAADYVFIGNVTFVPGARSMNLGYPQAYQAGWGYLLLTNALPHIPTNAPQGGQGTFTLRAYAFDTANQVTLLGTKTITLANDTATVPFGAIDTPEQGATIPGSTFPYNEPQAYPVFGWAVTQAGKCIDTTSASTYKVFIDGVQRTLTPGTNWFAGLNRSDLAAAYPGLCNSTNALAAYYLDTRTLANGLHTIGWEVTDNNGQTAGIGSRFFSVLNTGGDAGAEAPASTGTDAPRRRMEAAASASASVRTTARALRAAVGQADTSVWVRADEDGVYRVRVPQTGRLAMDLDGAVTSGIQKVGDEWVALPAGSTLDADAGRFFWQPPVGFLGAFQLAFVSGGERIDVEVTIVDPTAGGGDAEVTITSPRAGANPNPIITVTGTARDPQALTGTGIDTVHVWARRLDGPGVQGSKGPEVQFLGKAALSGDGYTLTSSPLAAGTYQIEVYAWVARKGTWAPAATVIIAVR